MKTKPPPDRRKFAGTRDEAEYLYHKVLYWLYERQETARARAFAKRLGRLLGEAEEGSIFIEECRSLICEAKGDRAGAIEHRENEIRLRKRLDQISRQSPQRETILQLHNPGDLSERLQLLGLLYHENGQLDQAIEVLEDSKQLCREQHIPFGAGDILGEYLQERKRTMREPVRLNGRQS